MVKVTTSSLLSVTGECGTHRAFLASPASQGPGTPPRARNTLGSDPGSTRNRNGMRRVATVTNVFAIPHHENGAARDTASRASRARAGRLLPGPPLRAQGDHRHLLHRAGPRAGRDPLLPLRQRGRGPRRRAAAVHRHGLQERAGRPGPRRRQGGHHRRPGPGQDRSAAARLRPLRRLTRRALRHRLRRRHAQRGHGRHRQGMPLDDGPDDRQRRRGRLVRADRRRRHARHARGGRTRLGQHQPAGPDRRRRGRRQGRAPPRRPPHRGRGRGDRLRRQPGRGRRRPRSPPAGPRGRGRRGAGRGELDILPRARWAGR